MHIHFLTPHTLYSSFTHVHTLFSVLTPQTLYSFQSCIINNTYTFLSVNPLDIVFFGEALPDRFVRCAKEDMQKCDLLIVMGTSLLVHPFASLVDR